MVLFTPKHTLSFIRHLPKVIGSFPEVKDQKIVNYRFT